MESQTLLVWLIVLGMVLGSLGYIYYKNLGQIKARPRKTGKKAKEYWSLE